MFANNLIRPANSNDRAAVTQLALINNMFEVGELADFTEMFRAATNGELEGHQWFVAIAPDDHVVAAAYLAPEPFANRLWNLYSIAVSPSDHGRGTGSHLISDLESRLRDAGEEVARVLIVETSSTEQYTGARGFYQARGFDEEARIRDFYGPGDDKVVFWKALTSE